MTVEREPILMPEGFEFAANDVAASEILSLRDEPVTHESLRVWELCLRQSLRVVGVREQATQRLVGIAMLSGNQRHAELVDGTVAPDVRERGIGGVIMDELVSYARDQGIEYVGLTYDPNQPWLKDAYARHGFEPIDFAMWLSDSVERLQ